MCELKVPVKIGFVVFIFLAYFTLYNTNAYI